MYSTDTHVLLPAICWMSTLDTNSAVIIGTGEHSRKVMLRPIYDKLGLASLQKLKLDQGVDKLTPAYSGCLQMQDGKLLSLLTNEASAPEAARQDANVCPLTSNQPASVHSDDLANETIFGTIANRNWT